MNKQQIQKEINLMRDLTFALMDLCKGYPNYLASFALMQAAATLIAVNHSQASIDEAPEMFKDLIGTSFQIAKDTGMRK